MTNTRKITDSEWQLITSSACSFQVLGQREVKVTEQLSKPAISIENYKIALPREMYTFDPGGGSLYALAIGENNSIGYDLA